MRIGSSLRPWVEAAWVSAVYLLTTILYFYPTFGSFSTALIGPPEDNMVFYWFVWYGGQSLFDPNLAFMKSPFVYYPEGFNLLFANYYYYGAFLSAILNNFLDAIQIYNVLVLHTFVFAGLSAFLLLKYLTRNTPVSVVGGFVFAFNPSHVGHSMSHVTLATIQFFPLLLLFLIKSFREKGNRNLSAAAAVLVLCALADWTYFIFGLIMMFLSYVYLACRRKSFLPKDILFKLAGIALSAFIILSPLIVPMLFEGFKHEFGNADGTVWLAESYGGYDYYVADLAAFFVPPLGHVLSGWDWINQLNEKVVGGGARVWERVAYLGWINLIVLMITFRKTIRVTWKYWLGFVAFAVLAMGSHLQVWGNKLSVVLPYRLIEWTPFFNNARAPGRVMVLVYLFLAILVAFSLMRFVESKKLLSRCVLGAVVLLIFVDFYSARAQTTKVQIPNAYHFILRDKDRDFGIFEFPWEGSRSMMYQVVHKIPIVQGYVGRKVGKTLIDKIPTDLNRVGEHKPIFIENKVKYILIHKRKIDWSNATLSVREYRQLMERIADLYGVHYEKVYDDIEAAVFKVY